MASTCGATARWPRCARAATPSRRTSSPWAWGWRRPPGWPPPRGRPPARSAARPPATPLGGRAGVGPPAGGLPLGALGGLRADDRQRVADGVWAAGDCCEALERLEGRRVYVPLGTHANKQGRVAGENLAGGEARFGGVLGTAVTQFV